MLKILVVDDDQDLNNTCCRVVGSMGFNVLTAGTVAEAKAILKDHRIDLILLDLKLPGGGGLSLLEQVKALHPQTLVVVMTAFATVTSAIEAMRMGAADYLTKPFAIEELTTILERVERRNHFDLESRRLRERLRTPRGMGDLVGNSPEMEKLYRILSKVAFSNHPVLILGESGTGKESVARSIHASGPHAAKPFIPVDCGSLPPALIEGELFGQQDAFSGTLREGLLTMAAGGTVFLDEIANLPLEIQAKLLRALQERQFRPAGGNHTLTFSARVLAATNRDLASMVEQGRFRKDLYFRLNVVTLRIPALRDRRSDIPIFAASFLEKVDRESGVERTFSDDTLRIFSEYEWPGNIRELESAIQRACTISSGPMLYMGDLPTQLQDFRLHHDRLDSIRATEESDLDGVLGVGLGRGTIISIAEMEKQAILSTIHQLNGDKLMAAKLLGIGKTTLYRKLKEYGISEQAEEAP